jgi:hypothetical protein
MGLKGFHIFFIILACFSSFGAAGLFLQQRSVDSGPLPVIGAVTSFLSGIILLLYAGWALRKLRNLPKE